MSSEKNMSLDEKFDLHTEYAFQSVIHLVNALEAFCENQTENLMNEAKKVIQLENDADNLRRKLSILIRETLPPYLGQDRFKLLDLIDDVADRAELLARYLMIYPVTVPSSLKASIKALAAKTLETVKTMFEAERALWVNIDEAFKKSEIVEVLREQVRDAQFEVIRNILTSEIDTERKIILKEIATFLGRISDKAEEIADYISFIGIKYKSM
ncbi:MAG: DUF47 domain-containing protein [Candidatus Asgardarchaeia archaeon]